MEVYSDRISVDQEEQERLRFSPDDIVKLPDPPGDQRLGRRRRAARRVRRQRRSRWRACAATSSPSTTSTPSASAAATTPTHLPDPLARSARAQSRGAARGDDASSRADAHARRRPGRGQRTASAASKQLTFIDVTEADDPRWPLATCSRRSSYADAHRYDGAAIQHDRAPRSCPCALQPRDVAIVRDVWRYKFLSAPQLLELWWPGRSRARRPAPAQQAVRRRLPRALPPDRAPRIVPLDLPARRRGPPPAAAPRRHRPSASGTSRAASTTTAASCTSSSSTPGCSPTGASPATRCSPGRARPTSTRRPAAKRGQLRLDGDWSAKGLHDPQARLVRPDAVLEVADDDERRAHASSSSTTARAASTRTSTKFRRYDAFLNWWWRDTHYADGRRAAVRRLRLPGRATSASSSWRPPTAS